MASSNPGVALTWSSASSVTVSSSAVVWSDPITFDVEDWDGSIQINADNAGTPASGDVCDVYIAYTNGDTLGDSGDDYDTPEHSQFLDRLDTYSSNTPGEDPARKTMDIQPSGKKGAKIGVSCPQAGTRNIVIRGRMVVHRPQ